VPPLLEHLQQALTLDAGTFLSIFPAVLVTLPFKEAIKKLGYLIRLNKCSEVAYQIIIDKSTIPARERMSDLPIYLRSY
jgi:hypothetical protein